MHASGVVSRRQWNIKTEQRVLELDDATTNKSTMTTTGKSGDGITMDVMIRISCDVL